MALSYFTVKQPMYQGVDSNQAGLPTTVPADVSISGTVVFTPNVTEVVSTTQDSTVLLDPVSGRFNTSVPQTNYIVQASDTWASLDELWGVPSGTVQAANPVGTTLTAGNTIILPAINPDGALRELNNAFGVKLVDNVGLDLAPGTLTYRVDYSNVVFDGVQQRHINSFRIAAPGDGSVIDLNDPTKRLPV